MQDQIPLKPNPLSCGKIYQIQWGVFDAVIRFLGEFGAVERNKDGKGCVSSWFYICFILRVDYDYFELSPSNDLC